jgi:hypothetical protein
MSLGPTKRQKHEGEEAIVQTGEGVIPGGVYRAVFGRFSILGIELARCQVVINRVLFAGMIGNGGIAKSTAPLDGVRAGNAVLLDLSGELRQIAVL